MTKISTYNLEVKGNDKIEAVNLVYLVNSGLIIMEEKQCAISIKGEQVLED